jgi:hypothetical protein
MNTKIDTKVKLSILWIVVMLNMIFADIFSTMLEVYQKGTLGEFPFDAKILTAIAALVTNIPILMIYFARILPYKSNRLLNIIAGIFTIVYVIGGGLRLPHYIVIASVEVVVLLIIIVKAWKWKNLELRIQQH